MTAARLQSFRAKCCFTPMREGDMTCGKASRTSFVDFGAPSLFDRVGRDFARAWRCVAVWARRRRQRLRLKDLDDHTLKDIGVSRTEADWEARKPFWR